MCFHLLETTFGGGVPVAPVHVWDVPEQPNASKLFATIPTVVKPVGEQRRTLVHAIPLARILKKIAVGVVISSLAGCCFWRAHTFSLS